METEPVDLTRQIQVRFQPEFDGTYSRIHKGTLNGSHVAVKVLKVISKSTNTMRRKIMRERTVWARMNSPNVLPFYGLADDEIFEPFGALISPWCENGDLETYLNKRESTPTIEERVLLFQGVVNGVAYLHAQGVIHGDLKPTNVLLSDQLTPLLCDFGLARICSVDRDSGMTTTSEHTGTIRYLAPELVLLEGAVPTMESDVWAMGCVGLRVLFLRIPYNHQPNNVHGQISLDIVKGVPPCDDVEISCDRDLLLWDLLKRCWISNPRTRKPSFQIQRELPVRASMVRPSQVRSSASEPPPSRMGTRTSPMEPRTLPSFSSVADYFQTTSQSTPANSGRKRKRNASDSSARHGAWRSSPNGYYRSSLSQPPGLGEERPTSSQSSIDQYSTMADVDYMPARHLYPDSPNWEPSSSDLESPPLASKSTTPNPPSNRLPSPSNPGTNQPTRRQIGHMNHNVIPTDDEDRWDDPWSNHVPIQRGLERRQPNEIRAYTSYPESFSQQTPSNDSWGSEYLSQTQATEPPIGSSARRRKRSR